MLDSEGICEVASVARERFLDRRLPLQLEIDGDWKVDADADAEVLGLGLGGGWYRSKLKNTRFKVFSRIRA